MEPNHLQRLLTIVDKALALEPEERVLYLNETCGDDTVLRGEIGQLLESVRASEGFWEKWKEWNERQISEIFQETGALKNELTGKQIGPWKLLRLLGRGGMGTVWLAERADGAYEKQVALKLLHRQYGHQELESPLISRFEQERQILARLNHPNIAGLHDGGVTREGRPWLAMEYVDGLPVTTWCREKNCSLDKRLGLFEEICDAIRYAHNNLVVHRDLKPENILVTRNGRVKILDFGIAKLLDDEPGAASRVQTRTGLRPLSLNYAAPEQITAESITTATDVYALGLLLYELLSGAYPHNPEGKTVREIEQIIRNEEPERPSLFLKEDKVCFRPEDIRGDPDAITLMALRKEPGRRYENAGTLLEDVRRYRNNIPVEARKGTVRYRFNKWLKRHRTIAAAGLVVILSLIAGSAIALWQAHKAEQAAERATIALVETEQALNRAEALHEFLTDLFRAAEPDRPQDQLPSTEEILALGANRALDDESAPPAERMSMLLTIGNIYARQNLAEQAQPLLDTAEALAREYQEDHPEDLARALHQQAFLGIQMMDYETSMDQLLEAETIIKESNLSWSLFAQVRLERGILKLNEGSFLESLRLLEPLYEQILERNDVHLRLKYDIKNSLAETHNYLGNLEEAATLYNKVIEILGKLEGPESLRYANNLVNSASLEHNLGRFDTAEAKNRQALELYDRIFEDRPTSSRAFAKRTLSMILLNLGQFEEALVKMDNSNREWAQALQLEANNWENFYILRGVLLTRMHRWQQAENDLRKGYDLMISKPDPAYFNLNSAESLLAITLCHLGKIDEGISILTKLDNRLSGELPAQSTQRSHIHEARAICYYQTNRMESALKEIELARKAQNDFPGLILNHTDRKILHAKILAALNHHQEAEQELDKAKQLYLDLGLDDHPMLPNIEEARHELFSQF